jgi:transposase
MHAYFLIALCLAMPGKYQLSPFEVGQVKAHLHHNLGPAAIARLVFKPDGKTTYSVTAIHDVAAKLEADPQYRGDRKQGSGAPRQTTKAQDRQIVREVFRKRGTQKVTVAMLRKVLPWLKKFSNSLVEERLHEAGLQWMRRRRKTLVARQYVAARVAYCESVSRKHQRTLDKWCYSDGTTFYLDRTEEANESTQRRALGPYIWRRADCSDSLYADCVGPSTYNKAQGAPLRVWGLLAEGHLHISILPEGECMDRFIYAELIEDKFSEWMGSCTYLVQDFERCLRCEEPLHALAAIGLELVEEFPKVSQDFNAIENAWALLRDRLDTTLPRGVEARSDFIQRLKNAVAWINRNREEELKHLSTNQKERANDCLSLTPPGGRTKW